MILHEEEDEDEESVKIMYFKPHVTFSSSMNVKSMAIMLDHPWQSLYIYTVLPYCVIGRAGVSPPSRTPGAARHT